MENYHISLAPRLVERDLGKTLSPKNITIYHKEDHNLNILSCLTYLGGGSRGGSSKGGSRGRNYFSTHPHDLTECSFKTGKTPYLHFFPPSLLNLSKLPGKRRSLHPIREALSAGVWNNIQTGQASVWVKRDESSIKVGVWVY